MRLRPIASVLLAAFTVVGLAGCGVQSTSPIYAGEVPGQMRTDGPYVYFIVGNTPRPVLLVPRKPGSSPSGRDSSLGPSQMGSPPSALSTPTPDVLAAALDRLALGPTAAERAAGVRTDLPVGIAIQVQSRDQDSVVMRVRPGVDRFGPLGTAQISCTVIRAASKAPAEIAIVTPDGVHRPAPACGRNVNELPFAP